MTNMKLKIGRLWAGTEAELHNLLTRLEAVTPEAEAQIDAKRAAAESGGDQRSSRLVARSGTTGVVNISGSLVNDDDEFWNSYIGATGYGEIRQALTELATDDSITSIVLNIDSGGGMVSGMADAAEIISLVDQHYKPVTAHTGGSMCSAAYFLGSTARSVSASPMAEVGSIGVLVAHRSVVRALKENGVDVTVIRAGEYKALGHPFEELSEEARKTIQATCDYTYDLFLQHVADRRGVSKAYAQNPMGEGRVFIGQQASDVGLVDYIGSIDAALTNAQVAKKPDLLQHGASAAKKQHEMAHKLSPIYAAARAAALKAQGEQDEQLEAANTPPVTEDEGAEAAAAENAAPAVEAAAPEQDALAERAADLEAANLDLKAQVKVLTTQAAELNAQIVAQSVTIHNLQESAKAAAKSGEALHAIAAGVVDHLNLAMNLPSGTASQLSAEQLVAEHARLFPQFDAQFKAGGVAGVSFKAEEVKADPLKNARRNAARLK